MLLRKVTKRVRDQSWAAIAIAYAEEGKLSQGSRWQTVLAFYQASQVAPYRSEDTTYRELLIWSTTQESGVDILAGIRSSAQALAEQVTQDLRQ